MKLNDAVIRAMLDLVRRRRVGSDIAYLQAGILGVEELVGDEMCTCPACERKLANEARPRRDRDVELGVRALR